MGARYDVEKRSDETLEGAPREADVLRARQAAAAFLRAARQTADPEEREALRHRAADLLAPHASARSRSAGTRRSAAVSPPRVSDC